jgi:hypothetical protein
VDLVTHVGHELDLSRPPKSSAAISLRACISSSGISLRLTS